MGAQERGRAGLTFTTLTLWGLALTYGAMCRSAQPPQKEARRGSGLVIREVAQDTTPGLDKTHLGRGARRIKGPSEPQKVGWL
jgi:hypothetical protein